MKTRLTLAALAAAFLAGPAVADIDDIDKLVESVRQEALAEAAHDEARIAEFLAAQADQAALLRDARRQLAAANALADRLRNEYETNEVTLTDYEAELRERSGDLNDLFAIVRQASSNAFSVMNTSLVAAENPESSGFLRNLSKSSTVPSINDIKQLWTTVMTEVAESGKVVQFPATVIKPQGDEQEQTVTRAGVFTSVSSGAFLRFLPDSGKLVELSRQPTGRFQAMAKDLEDAESGVMPFALDPSKGAILSLMVQSPDMGERIDQGGFIGYLILVLGAIGVLIVIRRAIGLAMTKRAIDAQAEFSEANDKNPLGRLRKIIEEAPATAAGQEAATIRLDEQMSEESSMLNAGLPTVAVLAAVSPLLGLLGTVTGMIETFQSITLFGTGDPKLMSGGISQALITTQLGLAVAIPLVLLHSILTGRVNRLVEQLGKESSDMLTNRGLV